MGRAPCCDKANVKKGPWSPEEDSKLKSYIEQHGTGGNWIALPQKIGLKRCGKSCRLRWLNYLRPNLKHGGFSEEEDNIICSLYVTIGSRWSVIAAQLPGRTDNDIKNYWNTKLKKKLLGKHRTNNKEHHQQPRSRKQASTTNNTSVTGDFSSSSSSSATATYWSHMHMPMLPLPPPPPPLPPLPYAEDNNNSNNEEPSFNDQDSLRKLLIKLGGRFSNNNFNEDYQRPPLDDGVIMNFHQFPSYENHHHNIGSSSSCMVSANNYPQRLDGLEFFYGEEMAVTNDEKIIETGGASNNNNEWCESSNTTLIYPPLHEDFSYRTPQ
ncbi:hypothetical protein HN51_018722 [Arachis hypogaea]|uniref:Transcription factor n=2 Tax=Arachis TaxID=3817 RepID=A0A445BUD7_ARAHY|nr:transcription factor RAX3 [Arachis duranensis]XP_025613475.1 transcription factor RAX3 [Arachis hypogaea]QHO30360.1 Transcription factor [Arachis hypogaea]QHO30361.1 Transcription factor [Arachis hypogaea]RYR42324.1 hypothetical protein Ahy_A08g038787 [Arachis hypogaea]